MSEAEYKKALDAACREWEQLTEERKDLDKRLVDLQSTIATLSRLCGYVPTVPFSLVDGCRLILMRRPHPLTASQVKHELEAMGFDLSKQASPLASIHVTLKRLVESGQARFFPGGPGHQPCYQWSGPERKKTAGRGLTPSLSSHAAGSLMFGHVIPDQKIAKRKKR